jgi:hypothetical protein
VQHKQPIASGERQAGGRDLLQRRVPGVGCDSSCGKLTSPT